MMTTFMCGRIQNSSDLMLKSFKWIEVKVSDIESVC